MRRRRMQVEQGSDQIGRRHDKMTSFVENDFYLFQVQSSWISWRLLLDIIVVVSFRLDKRMSFIKRWPRYLFTKHLAFSKSLTLAQYGSRVT